MRAAISIVTALAILSNLSPAPVAATITTTTDWCTITTPAAASVGETISVTINYRDVPDSGLRLVCDLHWNRGPAFGGVNTVGGAGTPASGSGSHTFTFTVRAREGMTSLRAVAFLTPTDFQAATHRAQSGLISVRDPSAPAPADLTESPVEIDIELSTVPHPAIVDELGLKLTLIDFIDCTDPDDPHEMKDYGTSKVVTGPAGRYRITAPHNHAMFSYRYKTAGKDQPVLVLIEYPDDANRIMNFMTHDSARPYREHHSFSTESGVYTGLAYPTSGKMRYFPQIVWPQDDLSPIIVVNVNRLQASAAASRIWVYRIDEMPALFVTPPVGDEQRQLDMFFPLLFLAQRDNFGWQSPRSIEHLADYCNYIGVNRVTAMVYANQGWGAMCTVKAWDADDGGNLERVLETLGRKGIGFIFGIVADGMYGSTVAGGTRIADMPPAEAEKVLKAGFKEIIDRYGKYEAFEGIALSSMEAYGFTRMLIEKDLLGTIVEYIHSLRPDLEVLTYAGNARLQVPHMHSQLQDYRSTSTAWETITGWENRGGNWTEAMADVVVANWRAWKKHPVDVQRLAPTINVYEQREPDDFCLIGPYRHIGRDGAYFDMARASLGDQAETPYGAIFGTFMEAWLGLKRGPDFWDNKAWTAPDYNPPGELGRAAWANLLANHDRLALSAGSWTVKYFGLDPWMRSFAAALRALPPVLMETVASTADARVVVRHGMYEGKRYVYAVSRIPFAQDVVIDGRTVTVEPFALVSFSDSRAGEPEVRLAANPAYADWLTAKFDAFERLCAETKALDASAVPAAYTNALQEAREMMRRGKLYAAELTCPYGMQQEIELRNKILAPVAFEVLRVSGRPTPATMPPPVGVFGPENLQNHVYFPTSWKGMHDLSAKVSFCHDGRYLYVLPVITDNVRHEQDGATVRFSEANWRNWRGDSQSFDGPLHNLTSGQIRSIPLSDIGVTPGGSCGFLIQISDVDDEENHPTKHSWAVKQALIIPNQPSFAPWSDPRVMGELKLQP